MYKLGGEDRTLFIKLGLQSYQVCLFKRTKFDTMQIPLQLPVETCQNAFAFLHKDKLEVGNKAQPFYKLTVF